MVFHAAQLHYEGVDSIVDTFGDESGQYNSMGCCVAHCGGRGGGGGEEGGRKGGSNE